MLQTENLAPYYKEFGEMDVYVPVYSSIAYLLILYEVMDHD